MGDKNPNKPPKKKKAAGKTAILPVMPPLSESNPAKKPKK